VKAPLPLRESPAPLGALLRSAAQVEPPDDRALRDRIWRQMHDAPQPRRTPVLLAAGVALAALILLVSLRQRPAAPLLVVEGQVQGVATGSGLRPGDRAQADGLAVLERKGLRVVLEPGAQVEATADGLRLESGAAAFSIQSPSVVRIAAGAAFVEAASAVFLVEVSAGRVAVRSREGMLRIEHAGGRVQLGRGGSWSSAGEAGRSHAGDALLDSLHAPRSLARLTEAGAQDLDDAAHAAERAGDRAAAGALFERLAGGSGLRSQNALYELAQLRLRLSQPAAALSAVDDYRRRFPEGALAQEAALSAIEARLALQQEAEAVAEMDAFLARYPQSERAPEVRRLRESLAEDHSQTRKK
jgi:Outer membrane lipoprotein